MTIEETKKAIEIMQAYVDGATIEYADALCDNADNVEWKEYDPITDFWDFCSFAYRIKKLPEYRPFHNKEECWAEMQKHSPFGWLKDLEESEYVAPFNIADYTNFSTVYRIYTFADGTPFGVKMRKDNKI